VKCIKKMERDRKRMIGGGRLMMGMKMKRGYRGMEGGEGKER
jgi:hypothetical protein